MPPPGTDRAVKALVEWDPDGAGPATPVLVLGGEFGIAGNALSPLVATFDPAAPTWGSLAGLGTWNTYANGPVVNALQVLPSGQLVAAGQGLLGNGTSSSMVVIRNGNVWSSLGLASAATDTVHAMCVDSNGSLVAGGSFTGVGDSAAASIARWNRSEERRVGKECRSRWSPDD